MKHSLPSRLRNAAAPAEAIQNIVVQFRV